MFAAKALRNAENSGLDFVLLARTIVRTLRLGLECRPTLAFSAECLIRIGRGSDVGDEPSASDRRLTIGSGASYLNGFAISVKLRWRKEFRSARAIRRSALAVRAEILSSRSGGEPRRRIRRGACDASHFARARLTDSQFGQFGFASRSGEYTVERGPYESKRSAANR